MILSFLNMSYLSPIYVLFIPFQIVIVLPLITTFSLIVTSFTSFYLTYNTLVYRAVLAHPPQTINGKFRVTEQGEMITQNFGSTGIAERTLDIYTAAVLAEKFHTHVTPKDNWRKRMDVISEISCDAYRTAIKVRR